MPSLFCAYAVWFMDEKGCPRPHPWQRVSRLADALPSAAVKIALQFKASRGLLERFHKRRRFVLVGLP